MTMEIMNEIIVYNILISTLAIILSFLSMFFIDSDYSDESETKETLLCVMISIVVGITPVIRVKTIISSLSSIDAYILKNRKEDEK